MELPAVLFYYIATGRAARLADGAPGMAGGVVGSSLLVGLGMRALLKRGATR